MLHCQILGLVTWSFNSAPLTFILLFYINGVDLQVECCGSCVACPWYTNVSRPLCRQSRFEALFTSLQVTVLAATTLVGVDSVAASKEAATAVTHDITELEQKYSRVGDSWHDGIGSQQDKLQELKNILEELWHVEDAAALDLRRRVRTFIDEAERAVRHEQIRRPI